MRGATAPRLLLEVVCARLLLPSASDTEAALLQRIERIETRLDMSIPDTEGGAPKVFARKSKTETQAPAEPVRKPALEPTVAVEPAPEPKPGPPKSEPKPESPPPVRPPSDPVVVAPRPRPSRVSRMRLRCAACGRRCVRRSASAAVPPR